MYFDDRYDDGKFWIAVNVSKRSPERFVSQEEAVDEMFSRIGLERPIGYCDV